MLANDLLETATSLANFRPNKPRQADLRRAVSTTYYAMFHALAQCCADLLVGTAAPQRSNKAWRQVYRSLEHGVAKDACTNRKILQTFPDEVQDFANLFLEMREKREKADYDPDERVLKSAVLIDIEKVKRSMDNIKKIPIQDRRAFAVFVLLKKPRA